MRIFPEIWAISWCPFSSSTLNIALDNASMIVPSCSIEVCLAILKFKVLFYVFVCGKYLGPVFEYGYGMLIMCGGLSIGGTDSPTILLLHHIAGSQVDHRLNGKHHSFT